MIYKWLQKKNSARLIIFFNGWGMDEKIVLGLDCEDYDVVVLYDYNNLELDLDTSSYKEKYIVAWSMGVMIAGMFDFGEIKSATAICGTPKPIDNKFGIPEKIYNLTVRGFSELSSQKFMKRMFLNTPKIEDFSDRTFESKKSELIKMLDYKSENKVKYTRAIVADNDIIIPTQNQINYWKTPAIIHSGHCPFELYTKWSELL